MKVEKKWMWNITIDLGEINEEWAQGKIKVDGDKFKKFCDARYAKDVAEGDVWTAKVSDKDQRVISAYCRGEAVVVQKGKLVKIFNEEE